MPYFRYVVIFSSGSKDGFTLDYGSMSHALIVKYMKP